MKKRLAIGLVLVLLVGAAWWTSARTARSLAASNAHSRVLLAEASAALRRRKHAAEIEAAPNGVLPPVDLDKCDRDLDLFGRVIDEEGKPVAGANVETVTFPWRGVSWGGPDLYVESELVGSTRTASDGTFAIRLERGERVELRVGADGYGDVARENCQPGERVTITLRRGATLDVTAIDESGAPVSGVSLDLRLGGIYDPGEPLSQRRSAVTDATGTARLGGLVPGRATLQISHATLGAPYPGYRSVAIPTHGSVPLRITMLAGRTVTGRVVDADTKAPISGARVSGDQRNPPPAVTDAEGRYTLLRWNGEDWRKLEAEATGYGSVQRLVPAEGDLDFALRRGHRITGRLVREDGSPVEDGYVWVYGVEKPNDMRKFGHASELLHDSLMGRTSAEGRFELDGLRRELGHTLIARAPGLARTLVDFDPGTTELGDVEMTVGRSIEGVAVDAGGRPIADANVALAEVLRDGSRRGGFERTQTFRTDDLGRFRFLQLADGRYSVRVERAGTPYGPAVRVDLSGEDATGLRVTLPGERALTVLVVDADGAPVPGRYVSTDVEHTNERSVVGTSTDADGRAAFRALPAAAMNVRVDGSMGQGAASAGPVVPDGQEVRVVLPRTATIRGFARTEDGRFFVRTVVTAIRRSDGARISAVSIGAEGAFTLEVPEGDVVELEVGEWQTIVTDSTGTFSNPQQKTGWVGRRAGVKCPADGVEIVLRPVSATTYDKSLTVFIQDSTGVPVPGIEVGVYEHPKSWKMKSGADGRVRFEGLPSHLVTLNFAEMDASPPQHALDIAPKRFSVMPEGQEVVAKWRAGAAIRGRVVDARGRGVAEPYVRVTTIDGTYVDSRGDADGRFVSAGLPGLRHEVMAQGFADGEPAGGTVANVVPGAAEITVIVAPKAK